MSYELPEWSEMPVGDFSLEVLKDGVIVETIKLEGKEYFILGRQPDVVDIQMDHPSISRKHAVLNFRNDNAVMLRDFDTPQGTFLNKKRCEKDIFYRVYVGDMIKFGCSTRQYIMCGPENQRQSEYESENTITMRTNIMIKSIELKKKMEDRESEGISWGFREDAVETFSDEEEKEEVELPSYLRNAEHFDRKFGDKFEADIEDNEARNEKDRVILDKIRKKELKVQHMQEENRRIYNKEGNQDSGLTDGQEKAVARNDENIKKLIDEIAELVDTIKNKNLQRQEVEKREAEGDGSTVASRKRAIQEAKGLDDIEHDTTANTADATTNWRIRKKLQKQQAKGVVDEDI